MYINEYKQEWAKKFLAAFGVFVLMLIAGIVLFIGPARRRVQTQQAQLNEGRMKKSDMSIIAQSIVEFTKRQEEAEEITAEFMSYIVSAGTYTETFTARLSEFSDESGIKIERVGSGGTEDTGSGFKKQLWDLEFKSDFDRTFNFIRHIESAGKLFGIEEFSIKSGGDNREHEVKIRLHSVKDIYSEEIEVDFDDYTLLSMPENILNSVEELMVLFEYEHIDAEVEGDPLYYPEPIFKREPVASAPAASRPAPSPPTLALGGILWDESQPIAIINSEMKTEGENIEGATVERIARDYVLLRWRTRHIRLQLD